MKTTPKVQQAIKEDLKGNISYIETLEHMHHIHAESPKIIQEETSQATEILDADYKKADMLDLVSEFKYLPANEQDLLRSLLHKYETLFNGTLGT